jgi:DNA-binding PadR family transcriptional regulator
VTQNRIENSQLTVFRLDLLATLRETGATHGLGVKRHLEKRRDEDVNHGRLYPNLDELVTMGLVAKETEKPDHRTNRYRLTDDGERELMARGEWLTGVRVEPRSEREAPDGE